MLKDDLLQFIYAMQENIFSLYTTLNWNLPQEIGLLYPSSSIILGVSSHNYYLRWHHVVKMQHYSRNVTSRELNFIGHYIGIVVSLAGEITSK